MKLQKTTYRFFSYILTLVLFAGLACSSDDNAVNDEDDPIHGNVNFNMKLDGVAWQADMVHITTAGGPDWWEEGDDRLYFVTIRAKKFLNGADDPENVEAVGITIIVPEEKYTNPKHNYLSPPPTDLDVPGYSWAHFSSTTDYISHISRDPSDVSRNVGYINITGFEIGSQPLFGEGYVNLSGTFEFEVYGLDNASGTFIRKEMTEGRLNISNQF